EDTYPFLAPLKVLKTGEKKVLLKTHLNSREIPVELLIYCIAMDNRDQNFEGNQISIEVLMEEKCQVGRYFNFRYSELIDMLLKAENKRYIGLNNNFGNRYIEFIGYDYTSLLDKYFIG
ncbi:MAG: DUF4007 family protein, partial [Anaeroplasmataceae bacterium]|nr:DUF4007 family protein [Anaeroplasmataceae bacterium]